MDELPGNSHRAKRQEDPPKEQKKIEAVVVGEVSRRKKPLGRRIKELLVGGNAQSVGQYILFDVLLPAAKDTIADVVTQGVERMIFGEARSSSRRTGQRPSSGASGYVSYNRFASSSSSSRYDRRDERPRRARATHDFDEIILGSRGEAEEVIDRLFELVDRYKQATVSDLYDLVGISSEYTDEKWGWTDMRGAAYTRVRDGYVLDLPRTEPLD